MARQKIEFLNRDGQLLSGALETPVDQPKACALLAHCFTCTKDLVAASRIARALTDKGIAVLRFDFTGLGGSEGDFANTNFRTNLDDLCAAADWLARNYRAPALLIGHSLGGAAVLAAAPRIGSARAIVTIGAPATASHFERLLRETQSLPSDAGEFVELDIGGRPFRVGRQLLADLAAHDTTEHIAALGGALLVFHSPADSIVPIDEAHRIFDAARQPKSFITLEGADHLLSRREDARYVADVIAAWGERYLVTEPEAVPPRVADGEVLVRERNHRFAREILTDRHALAADEPLAQGGEDSGFNPYELLLAALGACTSMTLRMYAERKQLPLDDVSVVLRHERIHAADCSTCETREGSVDRITRHITLTGPLTLQQRQRLLEIAELCPVHKTLRSEILITSTLVEP